MVLEKDFGFLRQLFWPIYRNESKKVGLMLSILFLLCMSYSVMRNVKDTLILTIDGAGAEAIPFLKVWGMLPGAFFATWIFTKLAMKLTRKKLFFLLISSYMAYYLLFAFVLYPLNSYFTLSKLHEFLTTNLPQGFMGLAAMLSYWNFSLFYVITELWSSLVLAILFWGMANDLNTVEQAKRTYGILNIGSNIAPIFSGYLVILISEPVLDKIFSTNGWDLTIKQVCILVSIFLTITLYFFTKLCNLFPQIATNPVCTKNPKKKKMGVREATKTVIKDPYLAKLALIVISYNISINLADLAWKDQLRKLIKDPNDLLDHMSFITILIGILATTSAILFAPLINRFGWRKLALATPVAMAFLGICFFSSRFGLIDSLATTLHLLPLALTVYLGSIQNGISKGFKYCIFDATKEMAYLPLNEETRSKGKAAIDGLGSGVGKSGASLMTQGLIVFCGSLSSASPVIACLLAFIIFFWIISAYKLGSKFKKQDGNASKNNSDTSLVEVQQA
jgi:AAA family ATP:ADP antiporter